MNFTSSWKINEISFGRTRKIEISKIHDCSIEIEFSRPREFHNAMNKHSCPNIWRKDFLAVAIFMAWRWEIPSGVGVIRGNVLLAAAKLH